MTNARVRARSHLAAERREFAALLDGLSPEQWEAPSLCEGWRVRDVVGHLLYDDLTLGTLVREAVLALSPDRVNARLVDRSKGRSVEELREAFRRTIDGGPLSRLAPMLILSDVLIHQQDVRRPLGLPRTIPAERLLAVLSRPDPFTGPGRRTRALRFVATDLDWSTGAGQEVRGPGEALLMAIAGRPHALGDLEGDGVAALRERLGA